MISRFPNTRKGRASAKKYVYAIIDAMLNAEKNHDNYGKLEGWIFGGIEECDKQVVLYTVRLIQAKLRRKY